MILSNEHLVRTCLDERLAAAMTRRARYSVHDELPEPRRARRAARRILPTLALSLHTTRKGTPA